MGKFLMSPQEALLKIKAMFAEATIEPSVDAPEVAVANFAEYVLASGVKVMVDKLEVGGKVTLLDEAGNEVPAPVGEHTLADGSVIVLDETGIILEIKVPEVEVEAPESEVELMKKKVAEMEAQIEALKSYKKEAEVKMNENIKEMSDKFSKAISELTDVVIELTKTPSVAPTQPKQFTKHFESKNDKISRFLSNYAK
jgi:hypothetical protein